ncbi:MAG TPA: serine protease [Bacteroidales bacterium]|nr:serine protease [Bacteroidales bacterium]
MKKNIFLLGILLSIILSLTCCIKASSPYQPDQFTVDHLNHATVSLITSNEKGDYRTYCAGVWVTKIHFVTASHCTELNGPAQTGNLVKFTTYKHSKFNYPYKNPNKVFSAEVVSFDTESDLAVLKSLDDVHHQTASLRSSLPIRPGTALSIVGHPSGLNYTYITGIVSQVRDMEILFLDMKLKMIHVSAPVWHGNSGGGAFDKEGNLVGISSLVRRDMPSTAFFVHRDEVVELLTDSNIPF